MTNINTGAVFPLFELPTEVHEALRKLRKLGFDAWLCGGAVRDTYLGKHINDYDIFVTFTGYHAKWFYETHAQALADFMKLEGYEMMHGNGYAVGSDGFIGDWRLGKVNVIMYGSTSIEDLVKDFDLNMNMFIYDDMDTEVCYNLGDWDKSKPVKLMNYAKRTRAIERATRFKSKYPELDWSQLDKELL